MRPLLERLWQGSYPWLYEVGEDSLKDAASAIFAALAQDPTLARRRVAALGWAFGLGARDTVVLFDDRDRRPAQVLAAIAAIVEGRPVPSLPTGLFADVGKRPRRQEANEALLVFQSLAEMTLGDEGAKIERVVLDEGLTGYAIFAGSEGRRDLFNWLLIEAVPAAFCLRLPEHIYSVRWPWPPVADGPPTYRPGL